MISISSNTAEKEKICSDKGGLKKKGTLSVAFLCTSKPGVIWNSLKEKRGEKKGKKKKETQPSLCTGAVDAEP